jgi:hypothetical protein
MEHDADFTVTFGRESAELTIRSRTPEQPVVFPWPYPDTYPMYPYYKDSTKEWWQPSWNGTKIFSTTSQTATTETPVTSVSDATRDFNSDHDF